MKISVVTVWGNDPLIFRMIQSVPKWWDIILVEGTFTDSKIPNHPNPEYLEQLKTYSNVTLFHRSGLEYEVRNKYLEQLEGYDYALMMDSDEYIEEYNEIQFCASIKRLNEGYYLIDSMYGDELREQGRFFVNPYNFRYHNSHKYIINNNVTSAIFHAKKGLEGIALRHDDSLRPDIIKQDIEEYQQKLWIYESEMNNC